MRLPSRKLKSRTQPTWLDASPPSMRLASTTSCHWSWLLKSRSTAHTRSIGASITVERTTFCSMRLGLELQLRAVEGGHLCGHQPVARDVRIGALVRLGKEIGLGAPHHIERVADEKGFLGRELQALQAVGPRLAETGEELTHFLPALDHLTVRQMDLDVVGILRHQAVPVAVVQRVHVLVDHLLH